MSVIEEIISDTKITEFNSKNNLISETNTKIQTIREIILDTETTGLDPKDGHRIVEIGAIEMVNRIATGEKFHFYINPLRDMPSEAYRIHGISGEFLKDKPLFADIVDQLIKFIGTDKIVAHNAQFDIKFLNHELSLLKKPLIDLANSIDTFALAKKLFPGMKVNLDALCKRFKIDNSNRRLHGALKDAALLADVYVELLGGRQVKFNINKKSINIEKTAHSSDKSTGKILQSVVINPSQKEIEQHKKFIASLINPTWSY